jgi:hypothetical protein
MMSRSTIQQSQKCLVQVKDKIHELPLAHLLKAQPVLHSDLPYPILLIIESQQIIMGSQESKLFSNQSPNTHEVAVVKNTNLRYALHIL